ncbi:fibronectin type III domain-containing protein, partial [Candidatus Gracilibacteria bacterium]|nr:fibronectin type III domain-containing protein [Candidatus Gracilibacteria bacterium]
MKQLSRAFVSSCAGFVLFLGMIVFPFYPSEISFGIGNVDRGEGENHNSVGVGNIPPVNPGDSFYADDLNTIISTLQLIYTNLTAGCPTGQVMNGFQTTGAISCVTPEGTVSTTAPLAPAITNISGGDGIVVLSWNEPFNGGSAITGYQVRRSSDESTWSNVMDWALNTTLNDTTVVNGTPYYYQVRAQNSYGQSDWSASRTATPQVGALSCTLPWGGTIPSGQTVTAYQAESVPSGNSCVSEVRTCTNGTLSGTYQYEKCDVQGALSCTLPWGGTIPSGQTVTAYQAESVPSGNSCVSEVRTCTNGTLSGTYQYEVCTVQGALSCTLPWGGTIPSGQTVTAYQAESVPSGNSCVSQVRTCTNGTLSGTYQYEVCTVQGVPGCTLPWGGTIPSGQSVPAYQASSVSYPGPCVDQIRTCTNGTLSGTYQYQSCSVNTVVPSAPSLSASAGDGTVNLQWSVPSNGGSTITGFTLQRKDGDTPVAGSWLKNFFASLVGAGGVTYQTIGTFPLSQTTYSDVSVINGNSYTYHIAASNSVGMGGYSAEKTATPTATPVLTAPRNLSATPGNGTVALSWLAPLDNGGYAITGYKIERAVDTSGTGGSTTAIGEQLQASLIAAGGGINWVTIVSNTNSTSLSYTSTGLVNGNPYLFRVSAITSHATSPTSAEVSATPAGPPAPVDDLSASEGHGYIDLVWTRPVSNGSTITGYKIERSTSDVPIASNILKNLTADLVGVVTWSTLVSSQTGTSYHDTSVSTNYSYSYRVTVLSSAGSSSLSNVASGNVPLPTTQTASCGSLGTGEQWYGPNTYTQTWGGSSWTPIHTKTYSASNYYPCHFNCVTPNYVWSGDTCVPNHTVCDNPSGWDIYNRTLCSGDSGGYGGHVDKTLVSSCS